MMLNGFEACNSTHGIMVSAMDHDDYGDDDASSSTIILSPVETPVQNTVRTNSSGDEVISPPRRNLFGTIFQYPVVETIGRCGADNTEDVDGDNNSMIVNSNNINNNHNNNGTNGSNVLHRNSDAVSVTSTATTEVTSRNLSSTKGDDSTLSSHSTSVRKHLPKYYMRPKQTAAANRSLLDITNTYGNNGKHRTSARTLFSPNHQRHQEQQLPQRAYTPTPNNTPHNNENYHQNRHRGDNFHHNDIIADDDDDEDDEEDNEDDITINEVTSNTYVEEQPPPTNALPSCNGALSLTPKQLAEVFLVFENTRRKWYGDDATTTSKGDSNNQSKNAAPNQDPSGATTTTPAKTATMQTEINITPTTIASTDSERSQFEGSPESPSAVTTMPKPFGTSIVMASPSSSVASASPMRSLPSPSRISSSPDDLFAALRSQQEVSTPSSATITNAVAAAAADSSNENSPSATAETWKKRAESLEMECATLKHIMKLDSANLFKLRRAVEAQRSESQKKRVKVQIFQDEIRNMQSRLAIIQKERDGFREREMEYQQTIEVLKEQLQKTRGMLSPLRRRRRQEEAERQHHHQQQQSRHHQQQQFMPRTKDDFVSNIKKLAEQQRPHALARYEEKIAELEDMLTMEKEENELLRERILKLEIEHDSGDNNNNNDDDGDNNSTIKSTAVQDVPQQHVRSDRNIEIAKHHPALPNFVPTAMNDPSDADKVNDNGTDITPSNITPNAPKSISELGDILATIANRLAVVEQGQAETRDRLSKEMTSSSAADVSDDASSSSNDDDNFKVNSSNDDEIEVSLSQNRDDAKNKMNDDDKSSYCCDMDSCDTWKAMISDRLKTDD
eukprot:CAMPEP_0119552236 /NCGR_PEP_ID=MMETSP1352-20130426/5283_1 /TAXON_ID=265584 /ORGANISM="Stauroneis constricta, Strain CCMP1120" /LENGTH=845 /DNA_ID=CAMNT_0007598433 /DNA_START=531 /DNA_END=3068 /DNA_ORIENTATION=-